MARLVMAPTLAGLIIAQWLTDARNGAIDDFRRLIATDAKYARSVRDLTHTNAEWGALRAVRMETMRRHPELAPKQPAGTNPFGNDLPGG